MTSQIVSAAELRGLTPDQAAALWIVRLDGDGVLGDAALFQTWLEQEENRAAWERAQALWSLFDDPDADGLDILRMEALAASAPVPPTLTHHAFRALAAAAFLLVLAGSLLLLTVFRSRPEREQIADQDPVSLFATGADQRSTITLPDGSRVTLERNSRLQAAYTSSARNVTLAGGEASFDVAHDRAHPFVVTAGKKAITALGTRFSVRVATAEVRVALVEGRVRVASPGREGVILSPGQQVLTREGEPDAVSLLNATAAVSQDDFVEFHDEALGVAADRMSHAGAMRIIVSPKVAALRISGRFHRNDPERFARTASQILPVRVVHTGRNELTLRSR